MISDSCTRTLHCAINKQGKTCKQRTCIEWLLPQSTHWPRPPGRKQKTPTHIALTVRDIAARLLASALKPAADKVVQGHCWLLEMRMPQMRSCCIDQLYFQLTDLCNVVHAPLIHLHENGSNAGRLRLEPVLSNDITLLAGLAVKLQKVTDLVLAMTSRRLYWRSAERQTTSSAPLHFSMADSMDSRSDLSSPGKQSTPTGLAEIVFNIPRTGRTIVT